MSDKMYKITTFNRSIVIECTKPAAKRCPLTKTLALPNLRVWTEQNGTTHKCTIALHGNQPSLLNNIPTIVDLAQQSCDMCTQTRAKANAKAR